MKEIKVDPDRTVLVLISSHWLSLLGTILVTTAAISWLFVLPVRIRGQVENPYVGIIIFLIIPAVFFAGLAAIPAGVLLARRRIRQGLSAAGRDRKSALRRLGVFVGFTTLVNVVIGTQVTYRAVEHMETVQFCGQSCHVMKPEYSAYRNSPHSRIPCVDCHVVPGARGWLESKMAGTRQLVEVALDRHPRPIPSAMESGRLVPARETCEHCHWPEKFDGVRTRVILRYAEDEANTESATVLMMLIGGGSIGGIHGAHVDPGIEIRYAAPDGKRQTIPWVEYRDAAKGETRTFFARGATPQSVAALPTFTMQCVDCHNRPTHAFDPPNRALDRAITLGRMSISLPFIKKKGLGILKTAYASGQEAETAIPAALLEAYQRESPEVATGRRADIEQAGKTLVAIYNRNVFPDLKVGWGTYPNNIGHTDFPGCFRCHDGEHTTADGKSISQDCDTCHQTLALEEASPEILKTLGLADRIQRLKKR